MPTVRRRNLPGGPLPPTREAFGRAVDRLLTTGLRLTTRLPPATLRRLVGPPIVNDDGAELDLQIQVLLALQERVGVGDMHSQGVAASRRETERGARMVCGRSPEVAAIEDGTLPGVTGPIPVRGYRLGGDRPLLLYFHGGGFVTGSLASHDSVCRRLAVGAGCDVLAVDYRLAPESCFPCGVEDALAAYRAVADRGPVVVGGDSAGGNLAAVICQLERDRPPVGQLLIYPATDMRRIDPSHRLFAEGFFLTEATIDWFLEQYQPDVEDPRASPALATDLAGLPPAAVHVAGFDPLRDEGRKYARQLEEAGVPVVFREHGGLIHGFVNMTALDAPAAAVSTIAADLRDLFAR